MTKLICINSKGPMGASLVGSLVEKLGAVNVPLRRFGLNEYLLGQHSLNAGVMQERVAEWVRSRSNPIRMGGINILDRDSQQPKAFSDLERVRDELNEIRNTQYETLDELYRACMEVSCKSVIYKDVNLNNNVFIDYPTDFGAYGVCGRDLYDAYQTSFDDVRMIHLHRDFEGWINSVTSQIFAKRRLKDRFRFRLKSRVKHYYNYEKSVADLPGLHLDFHELFSTDIEALAERVGRFTGLPYKNCDWRNEHYDLYGKFVHFDQAFKPVDDETMYLDGFSRRYFAKYSSDPENVGLKEKVISRLLYMWCYSRFKLRRMQQAAG